MLPAHDAVLPPAAAAAVALWDDNGSAPIHKDLPGDVVGGGLARHHCKNPGYALPCERNGSRIESSVGNVRNWFRTFDTGWLRKDREESEILNSRICSRYQFFPTVSHQYRLCDDSQYLQRHGGSASGESTVEAFLECQRRQRL
jgi:hypothetical protein